jgi:hypothetical protein
LGYGFPFICRKFGCSGNAPFQPTTATKSHGSGVFGEWLAYGLFHHSQGILKIVSLA